MSGWSRAAAFFAKDFRLGLRGRAPWAAMFVFGAVVLVVFSAGLEEKEQASATLFGAVLWASFALASLLGLYRSFQIEAEAGALPAFKLAESSGALFFGKWAANCLFLAAIELALAVLAEIFFHAGLFDRFAAFAVVWILGTPGIAAVGTLFAFLAGRTRLAELLLPALLLPVLFPHLVACISATESMLAGDAAAFGHAVRMLAGFDIVYVTAAWLLFNPLLESAD